MCKSYCDSNNLAALRQEICHLGVRLRANNEQPLTQFEGVKTVKRGVVPDESVKLSQ